MCSTQHRCIETSLYGVGVLLFEVHGRGLPPRHFVSVQTSILVQLRQVGLYRITNTVNISLDDTFATPSTHFPEFSVRVLS